MAEKEVAKEFDKKADQNGATATERSKEADKKPVNSEDKPFLARPIPRDLLKYVV